MSSQHSTDARFSRQPAPSKASIKGQKPPVFSKRVKNVPKTDYFCYGDGKSIVSPLRLRLRSNRHNPVPIILLMHKALHTRFSKPALKGVENGHDENP
jgi:hypothetical protein